MAGCDFMLAALLPLLLASSWAASTKEAGQEGGDAWGMVMQAAVAGNGQPDAVPAGTAELPGAYVVSMKDQEIRLDKFKTAWQAAWPQLKVQTVVAVEASERGRGIVRSFVKALDMAMANNDHVALFFEDDAQPFEPASFQAELQRVMSKWPPQSPVLLLGGHHVNAAEAPNVDTGITSIRGAQGAYAWAVRQHHMKPLRDLWNAHAQEKRKSYDCDIEWWKLWTDQHPAFIATPLLVDHVDYGMKSNTWGTVKWEYKEFEGRRQWWDGCVTDLCTGLKPVVGHQLADKIASKLPGSDVNKFPAMDGITQNPALPQATDGSTASPLPDERALGADTKGSLVNGGGGSNAKGQSGPDTGMVQAAGGGAAASVATGGVGAEPVHAPAGAAAISAQTMAPSPL